MRGLLIANPNATTTATRTRDVLVQALSHAAQIEPVTTRHPGHARELAANARRDGLDLIITLGGDGTVHEVVNGMLDMTTDRPVPALATVPGGSANVFARACGLPNDQVEATGIILEALREGRRRRIGLGRANGVYFTCNAGLGMDAEIIAAMEQARAAGKSATPTRYLATALRQFFARTDRRTAPITVIRPDGAPVDHVFLAIVQNTRPWTYLGTIAAQACRDASFETGLDYWAVRDMSVASGLRLVRRLLLPAPSGPVGNLLAVGHDLAGFSLVCSRPVSLQLDGEGLGEVRHVAFASVPNALDIIV